MTPEDATKLREPFPASAIGKLPKGGVMLDYVGHAATTDRLLQVDPAWTWEPLAYDPDGLPLHDKAGNLWIKLTVCGVTRLGIGDGTSDKVRIGDAIRNAAMRFGVALDLWAKEDLQAMDDAKPVAVPQVERNLQRVQRTGGTPIASPAQVAKLNIQIQELGITDRDDKIGFISEQINRTITSSKDLTAREASAFIDGIDKGEIQVDRSRISTLDDLDDPTLEPGWGES